MTLFPTRLRVACAISAMVLAGNALASAQASVDAYVNALAGTLPQDAGDYAMTAITASANATATHVYTFKSKPPAYMDDAYFDMLKSGFCSNPLITEGATFVYEFRNSDASVYKKIEIDKGGCGS